MNNYLEDIINRVKISLDNDPKGIIFGELNDGISDIEFDFLHLTQYKSFLEKTNGARCGAIDFFWTYEELNYALFYLITINEPSYT